MDTLAFLLKTGGAILFVTTLEAFLWDKNRVYIFYIVLFLLSFLLLILP